MMNFDSPWVLVIICVALLIALLIVVRYGYGVSLRWFNGHLELTPRRPPSD